MSGDDSGRYIIRIRGLPWSATDAEIINFLDNVTILNGKDGIHRTFTREGRPSGEAYIEVLGDGDMQNALSKDHESMGRRYIEVFKSTEKEMDYVLGRSGADNVEQDNSDGVIRCRGLPFQCSKEEIAQFFSGLEIVPNGITLPTSNGRSTGEAFVQFANQGSAEQALSKHKHKIGHRYIEIFKSTKAEIRHSMGGDSRMARNNPRWGPYDRPARDGRGSVRGGGYGSRSMGSRGGRMMGGYGNYGSGDYYDDYSDYGSDMGGSYGSRTRGGLKGYSYARRDDGLYGGDGYDNGNRNGFVVHMRGLPFRATENDISLFFSPLVPANVYLEYGKDGRLNGEADVTFASYQDAQSAMKKDRATMQHRYIELFARFDESDSGSGGSGYDYRGSGMGYGSTVSGQGMGYEDDYSMRGNSNYKQF